MLFDHISKDSTVSYVSPAISYVAQPTHTRGNHHGRTHEMRNVMTAQKVTEKVIDKEYGFEGTRYEDMITISNPIPNTNGKKPNYYFINSDNKSKFSKLQTILNKVFPLIYDRIKYQFPDFE